MLRPMALFGRLRCRIFDANLFQVSLRLVQNVLEAIFITLAMCVLSEEISGFSLEHVFEMRKRKGITI